MDLAFLLKGVVIGFSIAAPVGPIGVLCIRRTLTSGRAYGFVSGLGAATADATYGAVAGLGLTFISGLLIGGQFWLRLVGGLFLIWLGVRTFQALPIGTSASGSAVGLARAYFSTLLLTLTNPLTILSFTLVFAGLGLASRAPDYGSVVLLMAGVFVGSALWWLLLAAGVGMLRERMRAEGLRWVNRVSGTVIAGFGVIALVSAAMGG
ncbi:MAG: LysE family translocator [Chloroflexia bacterium]